MSNSRLTKRMCSEGSAKSAHGCALGVSSFEAGFTCSDSVGGQLSRQVELFGFRTYFSGDLAESRVTLRVATGFRPGGDEQC
ncbi:MAG: hypothetical protein QOH73_2736 [Gaiellaceae bacterium]|jgi:hypothetical protein|nr:hypothetical protein [Gaiellaceae bacterium]